MKKKFWTSDKLVGLVAVLISLTTLIIFVRQTNIMDKQSRLSAMPYLVIETSNNGIENTFGIDVINYGVGPAIIDEVKINYKGKVFTEDFRDFINAQFPQMDSINLISSASLDPGSAISSGGDRTIIKIGGNEKDYFAFLDLMSKMQGDSTFDYTIRYKSIYNDLWEIKDKSNFPLKIK